LRLRHVGVEWRAAWQSPIHSWQWHRSGNNASRPFRACNGGCSVSMAERCFVVLAFLQGHTSPRLVWTERDATATSQPLALSSCIIHDNIAGMCTGTFNRLNKDIATLTRYSDCQVQISRRLFRQCLTTSSPFLQHTSLRCIGDQRRILFSKN